MLQGAAVALKALVMALVYGLPILGVWAASSLAAYLNGPRWAPFVAGALAFPVLPLSWEAIAKYRRSRKPDAKPHILTLADRLTLRTLAVNLVFLGTILFFYPSQLFAALSARGDWFVAGKTDKASRFLRARAFALADRFEWLYDLTHDNPFDDDEPPPPPNASSSAPKPPPPGPTATPSAKEVKPSPAPIAGEVAQPAPQRAQWPLETRLHPLVQNLPAAAEASPASVGAYLREHVADPIQRLKAVHDFVADRIAYDAPSYMAGRYPPQDAESVFASRVGVCAGYSRLMVAIGDAAGLEIVYVSGVSRDMGGDVSGQGHAWNAARIDQDWYLIDTTWDAGYVDDKGFTKEYSTDYLLAPPEVFGMNHLPGEPRWQLRAAPISRGDFIRQPNLRPGFHAHGLSLRTPDRSQVSVDGPFVAEIHNPRQVSVLALHGYKGGRAETRCEVLGVGGMRVSCAVSPGEHHVQLFVGQERFGEHAFVGQFEVNRRR